MLDISEMGAAICHFIGASESSDGVCPLCSKICPTKDSKVHVKLSDGQKELIRASWTKYTEHISSNSMEVFIRCIQKHPNYKQPLGIDDKEASDIKNDSKIVRHVGLVTSYIGDFVANMDTQEKIPAIVVNIGQYHKSIKLPPEAMRDYKNIMVEYMLEKNYTGKEGAKAWHHFTDKIVESIKRVPEEKKKEEDSAQKKEAPSTSGQTREPSLHDTSIHNI